METHTQSPTPRQGSDPETFGLPLARSVFDGRDGTVGLGTSFGSQRVGGEHTLFEIIELYIPPISSSLHKQQQLYFLFFRHIFFGKKSKPISSHNGPGRLGMAALFFGGVKAGRQGGIGFWVTPGPRDGTEVGLDGMEWDSGISFGHDMGMGRQV
jgi:hypothetical protein